MGSMKQKQILFSYTILSESVSVLSGTLFRVRYPDSSKNISVGFFVNAIVMQYTSWLKRMHLDTMPRSECFELIISKICDKY